MTKILFVCHGNICRSPMAEYVMKDLVRQSGREDEFVIASAATSREELGNPVYPPVRRKLAEHGIRCDGHAARQMTRKDYEEFGYLIGMDRMNLSNMARICGGDPEGKCSLLLAHAGQSGDVADPWYTGDFEATWQDVNIGCRALLKELTEKKQALYVAHGSPEKRKNSDDALAILLLYRANVSIIYPFWRFHSLGVRPVYFLNWVEKYEKLSKPTWAATSLMVLASSRSSS